MGSLALGIVGAGIGSVTGVGAAAGWTLGTALGQVLFPDTPENTGSQLGDLKVTGASYGRPIPHIYGTMRLGGTIIWTSGWRATRTPASGGGKGGGPRQPAGMSYSSSFAVAIAAGEIAALIKIWADGVILYDREAAGAVIAPGLRVRFYPGTQTQLPDSVMSAALGADAVPAYRGLCYLVFEDFPLTDFGNRLPNIEVLVSTEPDIVYPLTSSRQPSLQPGSLAYDGDRGFAYSYEVADGVDLVRKIKVEDLTVVQAAKIGRDFPRLPDAASGFSLDRQGRFWIGTGFGLLSGRQLHRVKAAALTLEKTTDLPPGIAALGFSTDCVSRLTGARVQVFGSRQNGQVAVFDEDLQLVAKIETAAKVCTGAVTDQREDGWIVMSGQLGTSAISDLEIVHVSIFGAPDVEGGRFNVISTRHHIAAADLTPRGGSGGEGNNVTRLVAYLPVSEELVLQNDHRIFKWSLLSATVSARRDTGGLNGALSLRHGHGNSELFYVEAGRYGVYLDAGTLAEKDRVDLTRFDGITGTTKNLYEASSDSLLVFDAGVGLRRLFLRRRSGGAADLGRVVGDLCTRAGLSAAEFDTDRLQTPLPGYVVNRSMSVADALQPLRQYGFFDVVESNEKLSFIPRNQQRALLLDHDQLLAPPTLQRVQESELPERISVTYLAADAGYQLGSQSEKRSCQPTATMFGRNHLSRNLPLALTADGARQTAEKTLYALWAERQSLTARLPLRYLLLDPADVIEVSLPAGDAVMRLAEVNLGADMSLSVTAKTISAFDYSSRVSGQAGTGYEQVLIRQGTHGDMFILDLPLLRDQDATAGSGSRYYFALDRYQPGVQRGALHVARDDQRYQLAGTVFENASWGIALQALPAPDTPWQTDRVNSLDVSFVNGGGALETISEAALLNGGNALLVGDEILQFAEVSQNGDGSYHLATLIRGRRGTEGARHSHQTGERVLLLSEEALGRGFTPLGELNLPRSFKGVGAGQSLELAPAEIRTLTGKDLRPYAPVQITATRRDNRLYLGWQRRTRIGGGGLNGIVPLSETHERYELVFTHAGKTVSKYLSDATEYAYELAEFNADFNQDLTGFPVLSLKLYQLSETIGRGYPAVKEI
ncbi:phage tail protein [Sneathiella marina]|uniref:Phage tail protein n=1 Tax=Sneathiella marina TaxID=2950108 RepID=A0ABY4W231_9PROT|nr:phage tail protein [Sneathiella marina]USG59927.1 phage tail protein [Sneathiella marina]